MNPDNPNFRQETKILRNMAKCPTCDEVIESKNRHDCVVCSCWIESDKKLMEYMETVTATDDNEIHQIKCKWVAEHGTGIMTDGGTAYIRRGWQGVMPPIDVSVYGDITAGKGKC